MLANSARENSDSNKPKPHKKISFVYNYHNKWFCINHLKKNGMNKGAMRQHVEGKMHKIDFDTGEPIKQPGFPNEIFSKIELEGKIQDRQSNPVDFWELKKQLEEIFPDNPEIRRVILAQYGFEGEIGENIRFWMKYEGIQKFQEDNPNGWNNQNYFGGQYYP